MYHIPVVVYVPVSLTTLCALQEQGLDPAPLHLHCQAHGLAQEVFGEKNEWMSAMT